MIYKKGVKVQGIRQELILAIIVADGVYTSIGKELVITSLLDGTHSNTSLHYTGCGVDFRTRYFTESEAKKARDDISGRLTSDYDVLLESNHIHVEYQPRKS